MTRCSRRPDEGSQLAVDQLAGPLLLGHGIDACRASPASSSATPLRRSSAASARRPRPRPVCRECTHCSAKPASSIRPTSPNRSSTVPATSSGTPLRRSAGRQLVPAPGPFGEQAEADGRGRWPPGRLPAPVAGPPDRGAAGPSPAAAARRGRRAPGAGRRGRRRRRGRVARPRPAARRGDGPARSAAARHGAIGSSARGPPTGGGRPGPSRRRATGAPGRSRRRAGPNRRRHRCGGPADAAPTTSSRRRDRPPATGLGTEAPPLSDRPRARTPADRAPGVGFAPADPVRSGRSTLGPSSTIRSRPGRAAARPRRRAGRRCPASP